MNKNAVNTQSAGEMPVGAMNNMSDQPGNIVNEMPSGAMTTGSAMATASMPEGQPGVEGEMPSELTAASMGAQNAMPAGNMFDGQPGIEGTMPSGAMDGASSSDSDSASSEANQETDLEVTGTWRLTFSISQITRK